MVTGVLPDDIVRHTLQQGHSRPLPLCQHPLSGIGNQYLVVHGQGQLRQALGQLAGPDQQQPHPGSETLPELLALKGKIMVVSDRSDGGITGGQVQLPNTTTSLIHGCQEGLQPTAISDGKWLHQDFHASPAGQTETFVFLGADAVLDDSGT
jgi:hypothetical protein